MLAALLTQLPTNGLELAKLPRPAVVADDDVIVQVESCGVCGTDIHILDGHSYRPELPFVLGHEPVGVVVDAGADARHLIGRRITMTLFTGDGTCDLCRSGDERLCPSLRSITGVLAEPGAYAEYVRVHARHAVVIPEGLTADEAASLVDSGPTAANSVRVALAHAPQRVLVLGAGPIGHLVAELLRDANVEHVVVERNPGRREALAELGHDVVVDIEQVSGNVDVVIDCTGSPAAFLAGVERVGPHGLVVLAGYATVPNVDFGVAARKEATIQGVRSGRREDLVTVLAAASERRITIPQLRRFRLTDIDAALDHVRSAGAGKAIVVPDPIWSE